MSRVRRVILAATALLLFFSAAGLAVADGGASLSWAVLSGGGGPVTGGSISLSGSLGQTAIGPAASADYGTVAGYWYGGPGLYAAFLPMVAERFMPGPDLVVDDLKAAANSVTVRIRNAGTEAVRDDFWVDVYFNPRVSPPWINQPWPAIAPAGAVWGVLAATVPIPPGGTLELSSDPDDPYYSAEFSAPEPFPVGAEVWAYADSVNFATSYGAVRETDEGNNTRRLYPSLAALSVRPVAPNRLGHAPGPAHLAPRRP